MNDQKTLEQLNKDYKAGEIDDEAYNREVDKIRQHEETKEVEKPDFGTEDLSSSDNKAVVPFKRDEPFDSEIVLENASNEWDEIEQRDKVEHITMVKIGEETLAIHKSLDVMSEFKKYVFRQAECLIYGQMFKTPRRFLFLWKMLFVVGDVRTFSAIILPSSVDIGLLSKPAYERFKKFAKIAPLVAADWPWDEIGKELGIKPDTANKLYDRSMADIQKFQLTDADSEIAIVNAAYSALANQSLYEELYGKTDPAVTRNLIRIAKDLKAKAEAEYEAFKKKSTPKF